jgi:hypothetical protein
MNDLPLTGEKLYVTSAEEILWGILLVAVTMVLHGLGMLLTLRTSGGFKDRFGRTPSFTSGVCILILASWMIIVVHLVEVLAWAGFFLWKGAVNSPGANASLCYYFALMDYTTLGSNYNLHLRWRLLEGMIAIAGLLTFAWSTGVLLTLAQEFQEQQMQLVKQRREKRHAKHAPSLPSPSEGPGHPGGPASPAAL